MIKALRQIRQSFRRLGNRRLTCPQCRSEDVTVKMTEWIIGHQVENKGHSSFCRLCKTCGHEWKRGSLS